MKSTRSVPLPIFGGSPGPFVLEKAPAGVTRAKQFKTYAEQVDVLRAREMHIDDQSQVE
ncbi:hypothetical protein HMPREF9004_1206 [Schaalia cardiffensis F0333]|uniref:Uncharacterized protein n=1 Tax=Schaalia cardiffensis F0333 TaxID=888050 RepID=N6X2Y7_9ACTO|nr:hypothetical protein HMPREF9004_1206 [Schaalia cardiffensis F0333]